MQFWGYKRKEGRAGTRNHVLILPTCACGSESCRIVAGQVRGAVNMVFNTGCSDVAANTEMSQKVLTGFACNPNVYGVVIIGLGCETVGHRQLREKIQSMTSKPVVSFGIQEEGGTLKTIEKATRAARDMAAEAGMQQKELCDISELLLGIECGGSDATSGIASNPAVGELSDLLVDMGASAMMSESIEWIGGEHVVAKRAANPEIHNQIIQICNEREAGSMAGEEQDYSSIPSWHGPFTMLVLAATILCMVGADYIAFLPPIHITACVGAVILVLAGVMTEKEAFASFEMLTVFMLAFMMPLGTAINDTGAGKMIADAVISITGNSGAFVIMAALWLLTWALTQIMSNTAACTLLCPIGWTIAESLGADPRAVVIAVFIASSVAVCTPMAIPANSMIIGPGNVKFKDFLKPGLAVSAICFAVSMVLLPLFYPFY